MFFSSFKQSALVKSQKSRALTCLLFAVDNLLANASVSTADPGRDEHLGGTNIDADVAYASAVANLYLTGGAGGGRVAEIGPGGSAAVALFMIARGCESVDLIDRFAFHHRPDQLAPLYDTIIAAEPRLQQLFPSADVIGSRIRSFVGEEAAAEVFFRRHGGYDAIVSNVNRRPNGTPYRRRTGTPLAAARSVDGWGEIRSAGGAGRA